jgi:hypothetical protein
VNGLLLLLDLALQGYANRCVCYTHRNRENAVGNALPLLQAQDHGVNWPRQRTHGPRLSLGNLLAAS